MQDADLDRVGRLRGQAHRDAAGGKRCDERPPDECSALHVWSPLTSEKLDNACLGREGGAALLRSFKRLGAAMERGYAAELDRRAIEADAFLRRSVPKY